MKLLDHGDISNAEASSRCSVLTADYVPSGQLGKATSSLVGFLHILRALQPQQYQIYLKKDATQPMRSM